MDTQVLFERVLVILLFLMLLPLALGARRLGQKATAWRYVSLAAVFVLGLLGGSLVYSPTVRAPFPEVPSADELAVGPLSTGISVLAAGDIATCAGDGDEGTAALLDQLDGLVLALGDNAYETGSFQDFIECYEPSWGRHKQRTRSVPGNHEYRTAGADGYFAYFAAAAGGSDRGYYSFSLGNWHVVALNSECDHVPGGCGAGSSQVEWLRTDLAANPAPCTLAFLHRPRFSSTFGPDESLRPLWHALEQGNVDLVLSAHAHNYERFMPQLADGQADPVHGIRQFVVGTGGAPLHAAEQSNVNSAVLIVAHGVLQLQLDDGSYSWSFIGANDGAPLDTGDGICH